MLRPTFSKIEQEQLPTGELENIMCTPNLRVGPNIVWFGPIMVSMSKPTVLHDNWNREGEANTDKHMNDTDLMLTEIL